MMKLYPALRWQNDIPRMHRARFSASPHHWIILLSKVNQPSERMAQIE